MAIIKKGSSWFSFKRKKEVVVSEDNLDLATSEETSFEPSISVGFIIGIGIIIAMIIVLGMTGLEVMKVLQNATG